METPNKSEYLQAYLKFSKAERNARNKMIIKTGKSLLAKN